MKDAPVGPHTGSVSVKVQFQNGTPGEEIRVSIASFVPDSEGALDSLFNGTFPVTSAMQDLTVQFDLSPCINRFPPDDLGPFCEIEITLELLNNGVVQDQQLLGTMVVRPGQVVAAQPVVLTAGNNPPVINTLDTARVVESALIRYQLTGNDPDGDLTTLQATDFVNGNPDVETPYSFFPPLASISGVFYAFETPFAGANEIEVSLSDSKFNSSALDSMPALPPNGDVFLDSVSVDTTADSIVVNVTPAVDSLELVFLDQASQTVSFVCGGAAPPDFTRNHFACKRPTPFTSSTVVAVPVDFAGNPGSGVRCAVPTASCVPLPAADRRTATPRIHATKVHPRVRR
jgi:hypothetical protein